MSTRMNSKILIVMLFTAAILFGSAFTADAILDDTVGSTNPANGFPFWYQDRGVPRQTLQLCSDPADPLCVTTSPVAGNAFSQQTGFGANAFYWYAAANLAVPAGGALTSAGLASLTAGVEAAYASATGDPESGKQITRGRIRIKIDAPVAGTYTVTHPFGTETFNVTTPGALAINSTTDTGCASAPCNFTLTSATAIGPFLQWDTKFAPAAPAGYLGNPSVLHRVTGSPTGKNVFSVKGPNGANLDGKGGNFIQTDLFLVSGKSFVNMFTASPTTKDFGSLSGGAVSAAQTFTITNIATNSLTITGSTLTGTNSSEFVKQADTCAAAGAILSGGTCTVTVTFSPAAASNGLKSASLNISSIETVSGEAVPVLIMNLSGTADSTLPTVASVVPANAATGAANNGSITATFSEAMDAATITVPGVFTLTGPSGAVAGTVTFDAASRTASFTPAADLALSTTYTATITTAVKDAVGNAMSANSSWSFTTSGVADTVAPTLVSASPADKAFGVLTDGTVTVTFSEAMDAATINTTTVLVNSPSGAVSGVVAYDAATKTAVFSPQAALSLNTTYTAIVTTGVKDLASNSMAANISWSFATVDTISPAVSSTTPANAATGVSLDSNVTAAFGETMDAATITDTTFTLSSTAGAVAGQVAFNANTNVVTFTPTGSLTSNTVYTATVSLAVKDVSGNPLVTNHKWTFTTVDSVLPTIVAVSPADSSTGVAVSSKITVTFSEAMDQSTITTSTFIVTGAITPLAGAVTYDGPSKTATLTLSSPLSSNAAYTATVTMDVKDLSGNAIAALKTWTFTTEVPPVLTVNKSGTGSGTVTGSPAGIDCGETCGGPYNSGQVITLTAAPDAASKFVGWAGGGCAGTDACTVTMNADTTVTALFNSFDPTQVTIQIVKTGNGSGSVTVTPAALSSCGTDCYVYKLDAATGSKKVTLIAKTDPGVKFGGWSGGAEGPAVSMGLTVQSDKIVNAAFGEPHLLLSANEIDFGEVERKQVKTLLLLITNDGDAELKIKKIRKTGKGAAMFKAINKSTAKALSKGTLQPGESIEVDVSFKAAGKGLKPAKLSINTDDPHSPTGVVHITGTAVAPAKAKVLSLFTDEDYLTIGEMEEIILRSQKNDNSSVPDSASVTLSSQLSALSSQLSDDDLATREYMAEMIITDLEGEPDADYCATGSPYADVYPDSPACKYIKRLHELAGEASEDVFYPEAHVTLEQLLEILDKIK